MKAIRVAQFGGPEVMHFEDVPALTPGPGQVLVNIRAAGVNPVDTYIRNGVHARKPALPYTPGLDGAGTIAAMGEGVTGLSLGDRVYIENALTGTYAEQCLCDAVHVHALPENISFEQGATIATPYVTAYHALLRVAHALPGETILVHGGSGGVGIASIQIAKAHGMMVMATAGSDRGRELARQQGADLVFDHNAPDYQGKILAGTSGRGVDVILEMLANKNLGNDLRLLARNGRVAIIGSRGTVEINPRDAMVRQAAILGVFLFNVTLPELASIHAALQAGLRNKTLNPVIGERMALADAARAHIKVLEPGSYGKIVLVP
jgi:NADPH2:quinone reductase